MYSVGCVRGVVPVSEATKEMIAGLQEIVEYMRTGRPLEERYRVTDVRRLPCGIVSRVQRGPDDDNGLLLAADGDEK